MREMKSAAEFQSAISTDATTVVKFYADWCPDCKRLEQHFEEIVREFPNLSFHDINVEEMPETAEAQNVRGIPSLLVFRNGEKLAHLHSANLKTPQQARDFLKEL